MTDAASLVGRASELGLRGDELERLLQRLSDGVVAAVLGALIRYEDALNDLASARTDPNGRAAS